MGSVASEPRELLSQPVVGGWGQGNCVWLKKRKESEDSFVKKKKKNPSFYPMVKEFKIETNLKDKEGCG